MYPIDKDIPVPYSPMSENAKAKPIKPRSEHSKQLARMEVGDSFLYPSDSSTDVLNKYYVPANRMGMRIATRKEASGIRVWRVS